MSGGCPAETSLGLASRSLPSANLAASCLPPASCPRFRHIVTGTFNTDSLHLLAYDTLHKSLTVTQSIAALGPHQFLALGKTTGAYERSGHPDVVYATTWASPPGLSAWSVKGLDQRAGATEQGARAVTLELINTKPITAASSYVHAQPPPFDSLTSPAYGVSSGSSRYLYSAGGPTGESHSIDPTTGALLSKEQEFNFLVDQSPEALAKADKTRKALRYGSHSIDVSTQGFAFVADLGRNAIHIFRHNLKDGSLNLVGIHKSPRAEDAPRHVVPSPDGKWVFSMAEHNNYVDIYAFDASDPSKLESIQSLDMLPADVKDRHAYRGDTVRLSPDAKTVIASTRGATAATKGIIRGWRIPDNFSRQNLIDEDAGFWYTTPTSGGKANAIEFARRYGDVPAPMPALSTGAADLAILTDDEQGWLWILEWDGRDLKEVAKTQLPGRGKDAAGNDANEGASHALWLS